MKKLLWFFAAVFLALTILFYSNSIKSVSYGSSRMDVANIQLTVFAAASAVLCGVNAVGAMLASLIDSKTVTAATNTNDYDSKEPASVAQEEVSTIDSSWLTSDPSWVRCPECNQRYPLPYIESIDKCPQCGHSVHREASGS